MHVIVLGAGVAGVTTAYYLSQLGCDVTVIDRADQAGDGATFANAGQLSYSFTDALAKPAFLAQIPRMVLGRDEGVRVRLSPKLIAWGTRFLGQCTTRRARENTLAVLKIALHSAKLMSKLREELPFNFWHRTAGKLVLLSSQAELAGATGNMKLKQSHGCDTQILSRSEAFEVEPALKQVSEDIVGAVYSKSDEVADSQKFVSGLQNLLEAKGSVRFFLSSQARKLHVRKGRVYAVDVDGDTLEADAFVVCMGAWSPELLQTAGVNTHVYPVRGYSLTLPPGDAAPAVSVTALRHRMVYSRLNGLVRIAGFADFRDFDTGTDEVRAQLLLKLAQSYAPAAADYSVDDPKVWGGFRPMTPSGQPLVGRTRVDGLFVNTGHGMLGWTLACSTGYDAAQAVANTH